ncbi:MAG: DUF2158 domain-containing protein [Bacteroidetes bacterium]|nr:MAG: DUF2158 domain-containing protein [Bacteroidota bacterium]
MELVEKFKIGDTVVLNSGGPKMTIAAKYMIQSPGGQKTFEGFYKCTWFSNEDLKEGKFHQDSLKESK